MTRGYQQRCPIALALDVLGDRWVLLILRELMLGPRRFTDLRLALAGIAPNLLSERLRTLEEAGLVAQRATRWLIIAFHSPDRSEPPFRARVRVDGTPLDIVVDGSNVALDAADDDAADLDVDLAVKDLVAARRGEPLALPPGPASKRFAQLFQFEMRDTAGIGALR